MNAIKPFIHDTFVLQANCLQDLFETLSDAGYQIIGPTVKDQAVVYGPVSSASELPSGWIEVSEPGHYRLKKTKSARLFGFSLPGNTLRSILQPPHTVLFDADREEKAFRAVLRPSEEKSLAIIGVRSCELASLAIHDKIFTQGHYVDKSYQDRRRGLFIISVNCPEPGGNCFCASMKTGPRVESGFDLNLTEIVQSRKHYFLIESGSAAGKKIIGGLPVRKVEPSEMETAVKQIEKAAARIERALDIDNISEKISRVFENNYWETIAERCLSCGNCTMVCPTCFCITVDDSNDLDLKHASRSKRWDSCFTLDHSYIHGGCIRKSGAARYRQWLMHKFAHWPEQFGMLGCVGCGRCITWCPAGIDIAHEAKQLIEMAK